MDRTGGFFGCFDSAGLADLVTHKLTRLRRNLPTINGTLRAGGRRYVMVVMSCPWCEDEAPVEIASLSYEFHCQACGTSALLADEPDVVLDVAA